MSAVIKHPAIRYHGGKFRLASGLSAISRRTAVTSSRLAAVLRYC